MDSVNDEAALNKEQLDEEEASPTPLYKGLP
jgi:hypothetical protein